MLRKCLYYNWVEWRWIHMFHVAIITWLSAFMIEFGYWLVCELVEFILLVELLYFVRDMVLGFREKEFSLWTYEGVVLLDFGFVIHPSRLILTTCLYFVGSEPWIGFSVKSISTMSLLGSICWTRGSVTSSVSSFRH